MALATYLDLCQQLVIDAGISGEFTTVAGNTGEFNRVTKWVENATREIEGLWFNWNFLHNFQTFDTVVSQSDYTPAQANASDLNLWDKETFAIDADESSLDFVNWNDKKKDPTALVDGDPYKFSELPSKTLRLFDTPTSVITISFEYWQKATELALDDDEPAIPEQFRYIIIAKALMYYAEYESADDADYAGIRRYAPLKLQLEASELPAHQNSSSVNTGAAIQVQSPGYDDWFE